MRRVILESPFRAADAQTLDDNIRYARDCLRDSLAHEEAPLASHLLYTQAGILDDAKLLERRLGMSAGWAWMGVAEAVVVYTDRGISSGMQYGIALANESGIPVEYRKLGER